MKSHCFVSFVICVVLLSCVASAREIKTIKEADCGFHSITQEQCLDKGCVWLEGFAGPWCQYPESPFIPPAVDLGIHAMNDNQKDVFQMCVFSVVSLTFAMILDATSKKASFLNFNYLIVGLLTVIAWMTRYYIIDHPKEVVFDEYYFGFFANSYCKGIYVFDIHPALAKLTHYAVGMLLGHDCSFDYHAKDELAKYSNIHQYVHLREISAFFGTIVVPIGYLLAKKLRYSTPLSILFAGLLICDSLLLSETRLVLTDSQLFFYTVLSVYCAVCLWNTAPSTRSRTLWTIATAVSCGCAFSVKFTALATLGWVSFGSLVALYPDRKPLSLIRCLFAAVLGLVVFVIPFYYHIKFGIRSGEADWNISTEYQSYLIGSPHYDPSAVRPSFTTQLIYLIRRMLEQNAASLGDHPYQSFWHQWIVGKGALLSYSKHDEAADWHGHIFISSDQYICFAILFSIGLFVPLSLIFLRMRHYFAFGVKEKHFIINGWMFVLGWVANLLPYALVARSTYSYHYLPGQFFGMLLFCLLLDYAPKLVIFALVDDQRRAARSVVRLRILISSILLVVFFWHFFYYSCFVYGYGIPNMEFLSRRWYITQK